jgi:hypothetical protein
VAVRELRSSSACAAAEAVSAAIGSHRIHAADPFHNVRAGVAGARDIIRPEVGAARKEGGGGVGGSGGVKRCVQGGRHACTCTHVTYAYSACRTYRVM